MRSFDNADLENTVCCANKYFVIQMEDGRVSLKRKMKIPLQDGQIQTG